jgi:hypothetical protein
MKVVVNNCWGGFGLSDIALDLYLARTGKVVPYWEIPRHDSDLVWIVENLGTEAASSKYAELAIVEIPDGTNYVIDEYDGLEHVDEAHQSWYPRHK